MMAKGKRIDTIEVGSAPGRIDRAQNLTPDADEISAIQFGSFSLGDVFESEIQKFGRFAFRGKHSKGESSKRFVDEFVKIHEKCRDELEAEHLRGGGSGKTNFSRGVDEKSSCSSWARPESPVGPKYPYGTCMSHLVSHSWLDPVGSWLWVPRGGGLAAAELGLGFPARREEIQKFGWNSRRVVRVASKRVDDRTFAEVAAMDPGKGAGPRRQGGLATHQGDRGGLARSSEEQISEGSDGNLRGRGRGVQDRERGQFHGGWGWERTSQDMERGWSRGGAHNQSNYFQSGYREEKQRLDQNRINPNKRQMEDRDRSDWEEQELRAKLRREQEERRFTEQGFRINQKEESWDPRGKNKSLQGEPCYNCNMVGHLRKNCSNPPYCYCCKKSGHRSTVCPEKRGLRLCGYGILGQDFYSIRVPVDKETKKEVLGVMNIVSGIASTKIIERELMHLFREVPKWTIKQMDSEEKYLVKFPNEEIRYQVAKFKSFEFETANVKAKVIPTDMVVDAEEKLETIWVKAYKFPPFARKEDIVMEIAYLIGDPIEVDLVTLNREGPIRIKLSCRESQKIGGELKSFSMERGTTSGGRWKNHNKNLAKLHPNLTEERILMMKMRRHKKKGNFMEKTILGVVSQMMGERQDQAFWNRTGKEMGVLTTEREGGNRT
jgi:hypothetical protein